MTNLVSEGVGALPAAYTWRRDEPGPKMITEALKLFSTIEAPGARDNPTILAWAKEVGQGSVYSHDSIAWCGLFMAVVAKRAGKSVVDKPLWALSWGDFGRPAPAAMLGDVLTFRRDGGGQAGGIARLRRAVLGLVRRFAKEVALMGWEIPAGAAVALLLAVVGWIWRLSSRLATADGRIQAAEIMASNASAKVTTIGQDLAGHKEHVAAEYVSWDALKEVTGAINRLGDRLDALFIQLMPKP
jgi:uncharacterized protein (TIGR02594 family)